MKKFTTITLLATLALTLIINAIEVVASIKTGYPVNYSSYCTMYSLITIAFATLASGKKKNKAEA